MQKSLFARLPWMIWMLSAPTGISALWLMVWNSRRFGDPIYEYWAADLIWATIVPLVGALIASRQPRNPIGWILCLGGLSAGLSWATAEYVACTLHAQVGARMLTVWAAWFSNVASIGIFVSAVFLMLLFPNGQPLTPRWRLFLWCVGVGFTLLTVASALQPGRFETFPAINNPLGITTAAPLLHGTAIAGGILAAVGLAAGPITLFLRFHRSRGLERQQVKWIAFSATSLPLSLFLNDLFPDLAWLIGGTSITFVVLTIGIAILRYRLYDIDLLINKTLVYALLSGTLALVYFGSIVVIQQLFRALTGQESQFAIVVSTLVIAALFNPLRHRIQGFIDHRFYRRKYNAQKTLAAFSASTQSAASADLEHLTRELVRVIEETVQPEHASVWIWEARQGGAELSTAGWKGSGYQ